MKHRKVWPAVITACLALGLLAGCGSENGETEGTVRFRAEISADDAADIVRTDDVTLKAGQSVQDAMDEITYDADTVNSVSFSFNHVDFKTPGVYTASCTAIVSADTAEEILNERIDLEGRDDVSLTFAFPVTVVK